MFRLLAADALRVRHRHHRTPACRGRPSGAHGRTGIPDDATEPDGVGPDAGRAPCARADRQDASRRAAAAPGHRGAEPRTAAEAGVRRGAAPSELLAEAKQHLDEAIAVARSLNVELFPPVLQRSGLPAALTWLANWTHDKYKLSVEITADPRADSARKDVRTLLFESVRELSSTRSNTRRRIASR